MMSQLKSLQAMGFAAAVCLVMLPARSEAAFIWINPAGGVFSDAASWDAGVAPGATDQALFNLMSAYTVSLTSVASVNSISVTQGDLTLDLAGFALDASATVFGLSVGALSGENGALTIINGQLTSDDGLIGFFTGSAGVVTVTGLGASWSVLDELIVGNFGQASLTVSGGGAISYQTRCVFGLGGGANAQGLVTGAGSTLSGVGGITIGEPNGSNIALLTLSNGGVAQAPIILIQGVGFLAGDSEAQSNVTNAGIVAPSPAGGALTITGDYIQTVNGRLAIDVDALGVDAVHVTGAASIAGKLIVSISTNYSPTPGVLFDILTASSITGVFESVTLVGATTDRFAQLVYTPTSVRLSIGVGAPPAGDLNGDGFVTVIDLATLIGFWGAAGGPADINADGVVDAFDLAILVGNWSSLP